MLLINFVKKKRECIIPKIIAQQAFENLNFDLSETLITL